MPYRVEGTRGQICELLRLSPRPLKAKEIAAALSTASSMALSKRDVNPILYELQKYGVASRVTPIIDGQSNLRPSTVELRRINSFGPLTLRNDGESGS